MTAMLRERADLGLAARRGLLADAVDALRDLAGVLAEASDRDLTDLLGELDEVGALAGAGRVAVTAEAVARGTVVRSQARSVAGWVAQHAPSQRSGGAAAVAKVAQALAEDNCGPVRSAVLAGRVSPQVAASVMGEYDRLRPSLQDAAAPDVLDAMLSVGADHGVRGVREVRPALLARFGVPGQLQADQEAASRFVSLSRPRADLPGTVAYRLVLDVEGQAVLEAAIGPLSAPVVGVDGEPDPRPDDRRRGEALVEVCRRTTGSAAAAGEGYLPASPKATLLLTMPLDDLAARVGAATVEGTTESGGRIAPETVRRIACDAGVVPAVLGTQSEVLDLGFRQRLFTAGQTRALWLRDGGCTFPRCDAPSFWCDAHHLTHWVDDGPTDLSNAALLCGRHHTIVHLQRLAGRVTPEGVEWDCETGSYDRLIALTSRGSAGAAPHRAAARSATGGDHEAVSGRVHRPGEFERRKSGTAAGPAPPDE